MRHKQLSRVISLLVAFVMCIGMLPGAALAQGADLRIPLNVSSDESEETILIENEGELETRETVAAGSWKIQAYGNDTDIPLQDGWITPTKTGFTLDYTKYVADTGNEGILLYDSEAPVYEDSSLSFDLTVTNPASGQDGFICMGPMTRVQNGKNCEGLGIASKYPSTTSIQRNGMKGGSKSETALTNELDLEFLFDTTYSLKLDTVGNTTIVYAKQDEEYKQLATYENQCGLTEGTYGFRVWRGGKVIKVENIERTEIVPEVSYLKETEKRVPFDEWDALCEAGVDIPVSFADGDEVVSIKDQFAALISGSDYNIDKDNGRIRLTKDYLKNKKEATALNLIVTFESGECTYDLICEPKAVTDNGWVIQKQNTTTSVAPEEGWITDTATGGVTINYGKIVADTGSEGWVLFDSEAPAYKNSVLEYDITFTDSTQGTWVAVAPVTRVTDAKNYEGFAFTNGTGLERTGRKNGSEAYSGIENVSKTSFDYGKTYHLKMVTEESNITVYVTEPDGEEQLLTSFDSPVGLERGSYGFRIWRGGKTITIENIKRTEIITSALGQGMVQVDTKEWGEADVSVPVNFGTGDSIKSVRNGETDLELGKDYAVEDNKFILKKEYVSVQQDRFTLQITFAMGTKATLQVIKYDPTVQQEYTWTPDQGIDMWTNLSGSGSFALTEDGTAMRVTGKNALLNGLAPIVTNGEIEITFEALRDQDGHDTGVLFRGDTGSNKWQAVSSTDSINGEGVWDFLNNSGTKDRVIWDSVQNMSYGSVRDTKVKVRFVEDSITFWIDDQFANTGKVGRATPSNGGMGLYTDNNADVLVKKVVFREVNPFHESKDEFTNVSITNDGLTVNLYSDFPRVMNYTLNEKKMNGAELRYNYVTINTVDYPATAEITAQTADSVTYHVIPDTERTDVTFDVKFTVLDDQIMEMLIINIVEPEGEQVNSIGLPQQPLLSANSTQTDAALDATWVEKNNRYFLDLHETIGDKTTSTVAPRSVSVPIITADGLSASMFNNVLIGGDECIYRGFDLSNGEISVGVWNTDFMYRGIDDEKIMPFPSEPDETELYCRVAITDDNNGDDVVNWQDGANAVKKLTTGIIPGGDQAARSFFHVGYNFSSGAQQPFLQVADNMKRLSNYIDGFGQQLVFKGYASEGHDSGHSDYENINKRAGGAEDMNVAVAEADKINSNVGIHINVQEIYPEAKMFNNVVAGDRDGWRWMDQSKILRRYVDMLTESTDDYLNFEDRLDALETAVPDLNFVYVDCWGEDRWGEKKLIGTLLENGVELFGNENAPDFSRFGVWVHSNRNNSQIHQFIFNTQKDIYGGSPIYFGGYNRGASMMSWQHNNNINTMVEQFYTNQLPQKYLMCHEVQRVDNGTGYFDGNVTSSNYVITKDGNKITDGSNKIFIPWYAEDSDTKNPDEAAKIYHWNSAGGESTWTLPEKWNNVTSVYLYKTTQTGKVLVDTLTVTGHQVTIDADAKIGYVLYPAQATADVTDWSTGSPIKDTMFNSRDFSIWKNSGDADIKFNDDGNGVSILTMTGTETGQVSQTMTGLTVGQKYRVKVDMGAEGGKTARITVKNGDATVAAYLDEVTRNNNYFDDYAKNKKVQRVWVDFVAVAETAEVILSADACENAAGKVTFMQTRIVETDEPDLPKGYVANETFEFVEQGAYGIFNPERSADGVPHLSEAHLPYTNDTISGDWSLKLYGHYGQGNVTVRTNPGVTRLAPNTDYVVEFDTLGAGKVYVQPDATDAGRVLEENFSKGHSSFEFTTGDRTDYVVRVENAGVLDNFKISYMNDPTPPTVPANLVATAVDNDNAVKLTWNAASDDDGRISGYRIYRNGEILATLGNVTTYIDRDTADETEYTYQVSAVNGGQTEGEKSDEATVTTKVLMPKPVSVKLNTMTNVTVVFNKDMDKASAETAGNYTLADTEAVVTAAQLSEDGRTVTLTMSGMNALDNATLNIANVKDASGKNSVSSNITFTLSALTRYYKFDEAAGENAVDETGNEAGQKASTVKSVEGKNGNAARFDGNGYVDLAGDALYHQETYTISTWIKAEDNGKVRTIVSSDESGDASADALGITVQVRNDGKLHGNTHNGNYTWVDTVSEDDVPLNEWVHIAYIRRPGGYDLYLNGEKISNESPLTSRQDFNGKLRIGGNPKDGNVLEGFVGAIDEFMIFTAGLSAADIAQLAGVEPPATVPVTGVSLDKSTLALTVGGSKTLSATVTPDNATNQNVTWSSSDTNVASVADGVVTAVKTGTATITVTTEDGNHTATCAVTVNAAPPSGNGGGSTPIPPVVTENPDGSKTTTKTDEKTGTITETTEWPDGKQVKKVTEKNGDRTLTVTDKDGNKSVEIKIPAKIPAPETPFTDIPEGHWSEQAANDMAGLGLITGTKPGVFDGKKPMTRGMLATVLHRFSGELPGGENTFVDVKDDVWYGDAVSWATKTGIVTGVGNDAFDPEGDITREALTVMLCRYAALLGMDTKADGMAVDEFEDSAKTSSWAKDAMCWAVENGILKGSGNTLNPSGTATRAEVAIMLQRFVELLAK